MAIKDSAYKTYFVNHSLESRLAEHLDEAFDVTFGNTWGGISFWLSNPKPNVRERFGLQKEVLTIYSPHISTDARVLTAIEGISRSPDFKHRIEKVLYLLIYSGSQEETDRISKSDPDKIIVPFAASELENPQKGPLFLRSRIAERFGDIDLFGMSSPITSDHYFYGRENLVQELVVRSTSKAQNSGLFGLRKTGKTSVLWAVQRRLSNQRVLTEYIDCHNPGIHSSRWWHVLENISERLSIRLQKEYSRYASVQKDYNPVNCGTRFSSDIQTILKDGMIDKIILLLDEIEFITPTLREMSRF